MRNGKEILMRGDAILTELKKKVGCICRALNREEEISYNTGFHLGFQIGYNEAVSDSKEEGGAVKTKRFQYADEAAKWITDDNVTVVAICDNGRFPGEGVTVFHRISKTKTE